MRFTLPLTLAGVTALAAVGGWSWQRHAFGSTPAAASSRPGAGAPRTRGPLVVDVHPVRAEPFEVTVPATGTLLARESVELVSELQGRLIKIHADEGTPVKQGAVLFELDGSEYRAELNRLDVQIRLARSNAERQKALFEGGLTSREHLETTDAELDKLSAESDVVRVTLSKTVVRAPFSGTLGLRRVSQGAWVAPSTVLATLHDTSTLKVDFAVPERHASHIKPGTEFRFGVEGQKEVFRAKVIAYEPAVDSTSRSLRVRAVAENANHLLPGAFAKIELPLGVERALLVPAIAVVAGVEGHRVFVVRDGVVRAVKVGLGARTEQRVVVLSGIQEGDRVVVSNLLRVRDGARVDARAPEPIGSGPVKAETRP